MRIGILTFHKGKNYGAVLQTYALLSVLRKLGHEPIILDRFSDYRSVLYRIHAMYYPKYILDRLTWLDFDKFYNEELLPRSEAIKSNSQWKKIVSLNLDAIVVGSDQVWRLEFSAIGFNYYLDFTQNIKKISYAASFGKDKWVESPKNTDLVSSSLKKFHAISVREDSGIEICKTNFGVEAEHVLDPTLLLEKKDYDKLIKHSKNKIEVVSYLLGIKKDMILKCNDLVSSWGLNYKELYHTQKTCRSNKLTHNLSKNHISVNEWLGGICDAEYVITNSFHATIFSIIFKKKFLVIESEAGGNARIVSLLKILNLEDRFVSSIEDVDKERIDANINYDDVFHRLNKEKEKSVIFLINSLV